MEKETGCQEGVKKSELSYFSVGKIQRTVLLGLGIEDACLMGAVNP